MTLGHSLGRGLGCCPLSVDILRLGGGGPGSQYGALATNAWNWGTTRPCRWGGNTIWLPAKRAVAGMNVRWLARLLFVYMTTNGPTWPCRMVSASERYYKRGEH